MEKSSECVVCPSSVPETYEDIYNIYGMLNPQFSSGGGDLNDSPMLVLPPGETATCKGLLSIRKFPSYARPRNLTASNFIIFSESVFSYKNSRHGKQAAFFENFRANTSGLYLCHNNNMTNNSLFLDIHVSSTTPKDFYNSRIWFFYDPEGNVSLNSSDY
jgi:hypothetical protein